MNVLSCRIHCFHTGGSSDSLEICKEPTGSLEAPCEIANLLQRLCAALHGTSGLGEGQEARSFMSVAPHLDWSNVCLVKHVQMFPLKLEVVKQYVFKPY